MTNQEMIREMLDRDADFDLHDQISTADGLMEGLNALKDRMRAING